MPVAMRVATLGQSGALALPVAGMAFCPPLGNENFLCVTANNFRILESFNELLLLIACVPYTNEC